MIAVAVEGYFKAPVALWLRLVIGIGSLALMMPGLQTDIIGVVLLTLLFFFQTKRAKAMAEK